MRTNNGNNYLDSALDRQLIKRGINEGTFLSIGIEASINNAIQLAKRGFRVTASDISEDGITKAKKNLANEKNFTITVDDMLNSKFDNNSFDYVFDGSYFCELKPRQKRRYLAEIHRILKYGGLLLLKCYVRQRDKAAFRQYEMMIDAFTQESFQVQDADEVFYQDNSVKLSSKALFFVLRKT
jgi:SAM-dependent methyltransferase